MSVSPALGLPCICSPLYKRLYVCAHAYILGAHNRMLFKKPTCECILFFYAFHCINNLSQYGKLLQEGSARELILCLL